LQVAVSETITIELTAEFSCICPVNNRRDWARVSVRYQPNQRVLELTSFAAYLASYREVRELHEVVAQHILRDVTDELEPKDIRVSTKWAPVEEVDCSVTIE